MPQTGLRRSAGMFSSGMASPSLLALRRIRPPAEDDPGPFVDRLGREGRAADIQQDVLRVDRSHDKAIREAESFQTLNPIVPGSMRNGTIPTREFQPPITPEQADVMVASERARGQVGAAQARAKAEQLKTQNRIKPGMVEQDGVRFNPKPVPSMLQRMMGKTAQTDFDLDRADAGEPVNPQRGGDIELLPDEQSGAAASGGGGDDYSKIAQMLEAAGENPDDFDLDAMLADPDLRRQLGLR